MEKLPETISIGILDRGRPVPNSLKTLSLKCYFACVLDTFFITNRANDEHLCEIYLLFFFPWKELDPFTSVSIVYLWHASTFNNIKNRLYSIWEAVVNLWTQAPLISKNRKSWINIINTVNVSVFLTSKHCCTQDERAFFHIRYLCLFDVNMLHWNNIISHKTPLLFNIIQ